MGLEHDNPNEKMTIYLKDLYLYPMIPKALKRFYFILFFFAIPIISSIAQPCFSAAGMNTVGCAPFNVQMNDCSQNGVNISYSYFGNPFKSLTSSQFFTYTTAGNFNVTQYGTFNGSGDSLRRPNYIKVFDTPKPIVILRACNGKKVKVYPSGAYQQYRINYGDSVPKEIILAGVPGEHVYTDFATKNITIKGIYVPGNCGDSITIPFTPSSDLVKPTLNGLTVKAKTSTTADYTISFEALSYIRYVFQYTLGTNTITSSLSKSNASGTTSFTFKDLNSNNTNYCFKVIATDTCGNQLPSEEICNINLSATVENEVNKLQWNTTDLNSLLSFDVYANNSLLTNFVNSNFNTQYNHTGLVCNQLYCYNAVATFKPNNFKSYSDTICVRAISNNIPLSVTSLFSTITANSVNLSWTFPGGIASKRVYLMRSFDNVNFTKLDTLSFKSFQDKTIDFKTQRPFYKLSYIDSCGNSSGNSNTTSPVKLTLSNSFGSNVGLNWTDYVGYSVNEYFLEKRDVLGNVYFSFNANKSRSYTESPKDTVSQKFYYRIKTVPLDPSNEVSYSNEIEYILQPKLLIPNAFSPNLDGLNDTFLPKTLFITTFVMTIYNKWGEPVFKTTDFSQGWDGTKSGQECPVGIYAYTIEASDPLGNKLSSQGTVSLLK